MSLVSWLLGTANRVTLTSLAHYMSQQADPREMYGLLRAYYYNNGLYDELRAAMVAVGTEDEALKPLRNPAMRVVEFYVAKMWGQTMPLVTDNERIAAPLGQVWGWSNWRAQKQVWARFQPMLGDVFVKVASRSDQVFFQLIDPAYVIDFDTDERGYVIYIRVDVPQVERDGEKIHNVTHTEVWDKASGTYRLWRHDAGFGRDLAQLGRVDLEQEIAEFGIDFVPFVHVKHRDVGELRGVGAFTMTLDKIDEINRLATRLHRMLFRHNRNLWVAEANMIDPIGRPMPAPKIGSDGSDTLEIGDDTVVRMPGNSKLRSMVPQLDYAAALAILESYVGELERDLPELAYARLREKGDLSGRAVRLLLGDAIDRLLEARGNAEAGLIRANEMALTIGIAMGVWRGLGSWEAGDFAHTFAERDVIQLGEFDRAQIYGEYKRSGMDDVTAMGRAGFSETEIDQAVENQQAAVARAQSSLAQALLEQQRQFDQGQGSVE